MSNYKSKNKNYVKKYWQKYYKKNKKQIILRSQKRYKKKQKEIQNSNFKRLYNITIEDYNRLLRKQKYCCAICKQKETIKVYNKIRKLSVDHDHKTGKVRGLLCYKCNKGLGCFDDKLKCLKTAIKYLGG